MLQLAERQTTYRLKCDLCDNESEYRADYSDDASDYEYLCKVCASIIVACIVL